MDVKKLRLEMLKAQVTQKDLAAKCGVSAATFSKKMHHPELFTCGEALIISTTLRLSPLERASIFLL